MAMPGGMGSAASYCPCALSFARELVGRVDVPVIVSGGLKDAATDEHWPGELHANEVMLLPYYIATLNSDHRYLERDQPLRACQHRDGLQHRSPATIGVEHP